MRAFKKITALFIALAVMVSMITIPAFAEITFNDVDENTAFYDAIMDLVDQGVINGYNNDDGSTSFKPEATITRAEFTKMLVTATVADQTIVNGTATTFSDVTNEHWAVSYIAYASQSKIINGYEDGTFRPENQVTFAEAVKMIVCSLGYTDSVIGTSDPWYDVYISTGKSIGVTKGALAPADTPAQRGMIAQLIRNMLDCSPLVFAGVDSDGKDIYVKDNSTLEESKNNSTSAEGVFMGYYENTITGSDEGLTLSDVIISNKVYSITDSLKGTDFSAYLGKSVKFGYNNKYQVTSIKLTNENKTLTVNADDLYDYSNYTFTYFDDNNNDVDIRVDDSVYVIYNGRSVPYGSIDNEWLETYAVPECGEVRFLSNDGDSSYEVIFIDSYETYYVNTPTRKDDITTIIDKFDVSRTIDLDEDLCTVTKVTAVGGTQSSATLSSIGAKSVVSVAKPLSTSEGTMVVYSTAKVTGSVSSMSEYNTVTVNSKEYETSKYFRALLDSDPGTYGYDIGNNVTFYFDFMGKIVYAEVSATSEPYGYIIAANKSGGLDGDVQVKLISSTGSKYTYKLKSQVKVDGTSVSSDTALDILRGNAATINANKANSDVSTERAQQLVKYKTGTEDGSTVISELYTIAGEIDPFAYKATSDEAAASPYTDLATRKLKYSTSGYTFATNDDAARPQITLNSSTVVFIIPNDRTSADEFRKSSYSAFSNGGAYAIEPYEVTGTLAEVVVYYASTTSTSANVTAATKAVIVTAIDDEMNNGEASQKLTFMEIGKTETGTAYTESPTTLSGVQPGDIIKFVKDNGVISKYQLVYKASENKLYSYGTDLYTPVDCPENYFVKAYSSTTDYYQVMNGTVYTNSIVDGNGSIAVCPTFAVYDEETGTYTIDSDDWKSFTANSSTTKYYSVDVTAKKDNMISELAADSLIPLHENAPQQATKVVVLVYNRTVLGIVTYVD